jgi:hypothetical protein
MKGTNSMDAYTPAGWAGFAGAQIAASAALIGLVFVAVSINLSQIVASVALRKRALETLVLLVGVLFPFTVLLTPSVGTRVLGVLLVGLALVGEAAIVYLQVGGLAERSAALRDKFGRGHLVVQWTPMVLGSAGPVCVVVAGVTLLAGRGGGLYWLVPGVLLAYSAAFSNSWVLLVEILR